MRKTTNRVVTYVCFEKELFSELEKARGIATRSAFINKVLKERLREQKQQPNTSPGGGDL